LRSENLYILKMILNVQQQVICVKEQNFSLCRKMNRLFVDMLGKTEKITIGE